MPFKKTQHLYRSFHGFYTGLRYSTILHLKILQHGNHLLVRNHNLRP